MILFADCSQQKCPRTSETNAGDMHATVCPKVCGQKRHNFPRDGQIPRTRQEKNDTANPCRSNKVQ